MVLLAQNTPSFRSDVALVRLDAEVADGARILDGFSAADFRVLDNGRPQAIVHFSRDEDPLDVLLLFDISGSMMESVEKISNASRLAFSELHPGDRVAVMVFNTKARLVAPFNADLDAAARSIRDQVLGLKFGGGTHIVAAIDTAALYFRNEKQSRRRRAILVVTDDIGQKSRREHPVVIDAWESGVTVCGLIVRSALSDALLAASMTSPLSLALREGVGHLADKTGGDVVKTGRDPAAAFRDMIQRLRRRYSIYYPMPAAAPGEEHSVRVTLTQAAQTRDPRARVRARKGYLVPAAPKS